LCDSKLVAAISENARGSAERRTSEMQDAATMDLFSLAPRYELSVCVSGNATVLKWLLARFAAGHGGKDRVSSSQRDSRGSSGSVSKADKQGGDWCSSYSLSSEL
jgi:hypothetical protein